MTLSIGQFFRQCEARGPMSLRDHLNSTQFDDTVEARYMRNRAISALKMPKHRHLRGTTILNDGSRSQIFEGQKPVATTVPVPVRPASLTVKPIEHMRQSEDFRLPSTVDDLAEAEAALIGLSRSRQIAAVRGIAKLNDERVLERAARQSSDQRAQDMADQLAESRRDKQFLQEFVLKTGNAVTR